MGYIATAFEMPTISGFGDTVEDAIKELKEAFTLAREVLEEDNENMPEPLSRRKYSGQFTLRIPRDLHYRLAMEASNQQISINQLNDRVPVNYLLSKLWFSTFCQELCHCERRRSEAIAQLGNEKREVGNGKKNLKTFSRLSPLVSHLQNVRLVPSLRSGSQAPRNDKLLNYRSKGIGELCA